MLLARAMDRPRISESAMSPRSWPGQKSQSETVEVVATTRVMIMHDSCSLPTITRSTTSVNHAMFRDSLRLGVVRLTSVIIIARPSNHALVENLADTVDYEADPGANIHCLLIAMHLRYAGLVHADAQMVPLRYWSKACQISVSYHSRWKRRC